MDKRKAVFAGSFNPFTLGHLDILRRSAQLFDTVYIAIAEDAGKRFDVPLKDRAEIAALSAAEVKNAEVITFSGMLTDLVKELDAGYIVRGLRNSFDLSYETSLEKIYKDFYPGVELVYFIAASDLNHISSSFVREIASIGGDISGFVQKNAIEKVLGGYGKKTR